MLTYALPLSYNIITIITIDTCDYRDFKVITVSSYAKT